MEYIEFRGKVYKGLSGLVKAFGKDYPTVYSRYKAYGWTLEQALDLEERKSTRSRSNPTIEFRGKPYGTYRELCREYGVDSNVFYSRYKALGWSIEEALGLVKRERKRRGKSVEFDGVTYLNYRELGEAYDIPGNTVYERHVRMGWTLEQALELVDKPVTKRGRAVGLEYEGVPYESYRELGDAYGIPGKLVYLRHVKSGWPLDEALGLVGRGLTSRSITVNGKEYRSRLDFARKNKINYAHLNNRIRLKGMSLEEALADMGWEGTRD